MALHLLRGSLLGNSIRAFSNTSRSVPQEIKFSPVYVHHLTKVVVEHFQKNHHDWIVEQGLDKGLKFNPDGTFVLRFPCSSGRKDNGRIWTSYDGAKKQHWLSCYKNGSLNRFLIKDFMPDQNFTDADINEHIRRSVDQVIQTLEKNL